MRRPILYVVTALSSFFLLQAQGFSYQAGWYPAPEERASDRRDFSGEESYRHQSYYQQSYYDGGYYGRRGNSTRGYGQAFTPAASEITPPGEDVVIIDPVKHNWGAYTSDGKLKRTGLVSAGSKWCSDLGRPCKTKSGTFHVYSLGGPGCISHKFPLGRGGAPMPYCMFFNGGQGMHGSYEVVAGNISHGCVRLHVDDAEWLRHNFVHNGTKVIVKPY